MEVFDDKSFRIEDSDVSEPESLYCEKEDDKPADAEKKDDAKKGADAAPKADAAKKDGDKPADAEKKDDCHESYLSCVAPLLHHGISAKHRHLLSCLERGIHAYDYLVTRTIIRV